MNAPLKQLNLGCGTDIRAGWVDLPYCCPAKNLQVTLVK